MSLDPPIGELFARAREADLEAVAGVRLFRAGRRLRGECPLCGASKGKKADDDPQPLKLSHPSDALDAIYARVLAEKAGQ